MKFLMAFLIALPLVSHAEHNDIQPFQEELPIRCGDTDHLLELLRERFSEEVVMMAGSKNAKGDDLFHSLWINSETTTWSLVVVNKQEGVSCVIASGNDARIILPGGIGI